MSTYMVGFTLTFISRFLCCSALLLIQCDSATRLSESDKPIQLESYVIVPEYVLVPGSNIEFGIATTPQSLSEESLATIQWNITWTEAVSPNRILYEQPIYYEANSKSWHFEWQPGDFPGLTKTSNSTGLFHGQVTISSSNNGHGQIIELVEIVSFNFAPTPAPTLERNFIPPSVYAGDHIALQGSGFLSPGEGETRIVFNGSYKNEFSGEEIHIKQKSILVEMGSDRTSGFITWTPALWSFEAGAFEGDWQIINVLESAIDPLGSLHAKVKIWQRSAKISSLTPNLVRKGQLLQISGRGLYSSNGDSDAKTLIEFQGQFSPLTENGTLGAPLEKSFNLLPQTVWGNTLQETTVTTTPIHANPNSPSCQTTGFASKPGLYVGNFTPVLIHGAQKTYGEATPLQLEIGRPMQWVHLKYLPGFREGLREFGLHNVERDIRSRILVALQRDYAGFNVRFSETRPRAFKEFTTIEIGGVDPSGNHQFGLDNSCNDGASATCKDICNHQLSDYIGSFNADTQAHNWFAYGGVFVSSFIIFSKSHSDTQPFLASDRFDEIFGAFLPHLKNHAVGAEEYPNGPRDAAISQAIRVFGNLANNTITHEVAHSLGLSMADWEGLHNPISNPDMPFIMDAGGMRPFAERAEIDSQGPSIWSPANMKYLKSILQRDP